MCLRTCRFSQTGQRPFPLGATKRRRTRGQDLRETSQILMLTGALFAQAEFDC